MKPNLMKTLLIALMLAFSHGSNASDFAEQEAAEHEAATLFELVDMQSTIDDLIPKSIDIEIAKNSTLEPYREVIIEFTKKYMSYEKIRPDLIKIYTKAFTYDDLRHITEFYRTETGKKTIKLFPQLFVEGNKMGQARVQQNIGELQRMMEDETKRIRALQAK